jgi:hypothetical protein
MLPTLILTLGVLLLLRYSLDLEWASLCNTWPVLLIIAGLLKVFQDNAPTTGHFNPGEPPPAAVSGSTLSATGLEQGQEGR